MNPEDLEMLQDLIIAAVNEGVRKAQEMASAEMAKITGGMHPRPDVGGAMTGYALPIKRLIKELSRLPGIGGKTATRLPPTSVPPRRMPAAWPTAFWTCKRKIRLCSVCFNLAEGEICDICADAARNREVICVVEEPDSLIAIEESGRYRGGYHVLHGALSPLDGIGPEHLRIGAGRTDPAGRVKEIILATNPSVQGESTALLMRMVREWGSGSPGLRSACPSGVISSISTG